MNEEPTQADKDDVMGVCIAMQRAFLAGDGEGAAAVAMTIDPEEALAMMTGIAATLAIDVYGSEERYAAALEAWTPDGGLPGPADL